MTGQMNEDYGALVGWSMTRQNGRMTLVVQSVVKAPPHDAEDVQTHYFFMTDQQAVQLGDSLFEMTSQTKPSRKGRGLLARLFG
jgi:hypothetical protein